MVNVRGVDGMSIRILKVGVGLSAAILAASVLAGCSSNAGAVSASSAASASASAAATTVTGTSTGSATGGTGVIAPIIINFSDGTAQFARVSLNNVVVINTSPAAVTSFTGDVGEPSIAKFVPGHVDASATFNPGIQPLAVGATTVTITNTETGRFVLLDLTVTP